MNSEIIGPLPPICTMDMCPDGSARSTVDCSCNDEPLHSKKIDPLVYFWIIVPVIDLIAGIGNMHSWSKYFDASSVP